MNKIYKEYLQNGVIDEDNAVDIIEEQEKEIERLNKENKLLKSNPNFVYAMRNNKAIEYINGICRTIFCDIEYDNAMELLDILKGVDKE